MSKRVLMWVGAYVAAVAVFAAGMILLARDGDDGAASAATAGEQAVMPFPSAIAVARAQVAVGDVTTVSVGGTPPGGVASIDLYDGGRRVSTVAPADGALVTQVAFPALSVGPHALHAAVTDSKGEVALTPVATVDVSVGSEPVAPVAVPEGKPAPTEPGAGVPAGEGAIQVPVTVEEGETPADLAARLAVDPGQIQLAPAVAGEAPLQPDEGAELPAGATVVVAVQPDAGLAELVADRPIIQQIPTPKADAFSIAASARGCTISLTPSGAPGPVDYFEAGPSGLGWRAVGSGRKGSAFELSQTTPGTHVYLARSGTAEATPVSVLLPFSCGDTTGWKGDARIDNGILTIDPAAFAQLPPQATGLTVYLQVDGGTAQQLGGVSKQPSVDLRGQLPRLSGKKLDVQVSAQSEIPLVIAKGSLRVPDGMSMAEIVGQGTRTTLRVRDPQGAKGAVWEESKRRIRLDHDDLTLTFDWSSDVPGVETALWQVVRYDQGGTPVSVVSATDALAGGRSKGQATSDGRSTGSFTLDTAKIPGHEIVAQRRAELDQNKALTPEPTTPPFAVVTPAFLPGSTSGLGASSYAKLATSAKTAAQLPPGIPSWQPLPMPGDQLRLQVLIDPDGSAPGPWTQEYAITLPTPQPAESAQSGITLNPGTLEIDPGFAPDPAYARCGVVTVPTVKPPAKAVPLDPFGRPASSGYVGVQDAADIAWSAMNQLYPGGSGTYCMPPPKPPESCNAVGIPLPEVACDVADVAGDVLAALWEAAVGVYDTVSQAYSSAINVVVQLVSVGNPLCMALKEADPEAGSGCESGFAVAGRAAITVVLASFGLPPALPSLKELEAIASGDLAQLGRELMAQFIPCDAVTAGPGVKEAIEELGAAAGSPEAAAAATDPCLAMLQVMLSQVRTSIANGWTANLAAATGLPSFAIPGFAIAPDPRTQSVPTTVRYQSEPKEFDAQIEGAECRVTFDRGPKSSGWLSAYASTPLSLTPGSRTLSGGMSLAYELWSNTSPDVLAGQTITVQSAAGGGCKGGGATGSATIPKPPR